MLIAFLRTPAKAEPPGREVPGNSTRRFSGQTNELEANSLSASAHTKRAINSTESSHEWLIFPFLKLFIWVCVHIRRALRGGPRVRGQCVPHSVAVRGRLRVVTASKSGEMPLDSDTPGSPTPGPPLGQIPRQLTG